LGRARSGSEARSPKRAGSRGTTRRRKSPGTGEQTDDAKRARAVPVTEPLTRGEPFVEPQGSKDG